MTAPLEFFDELTPAVLQQFEGQPPGTAVDVAPDDGDAHLIRLRQVLVMAMSGKSQAEIGRAFNASPRTVRRWLRQARERRLVAFAGPRPEEIMARAGFLHDHLERELLAQLEQAKAAGDVKLLVRLVREIRGLQRDRLWFLRVSGYLARVQFADPPRPLEKVEQQALWLRALSNVILSERDAMDHASAALAEEPGYCSGV